MQRISNSGSCVPKSGRFRRRNRCAPAMRCSNNGMTGPELGSLSRSAALPVLLAFRCRPARSRDRKRALCLRCRDCPGEFDARARLLASGIAAANAGGGRGTNMRQSRCVGAKVQAERGGHVTLDWSLVAEAAAWATSTARLDDFRPLLPAEEEIVAGLQSGSSTGARDGSLPEELDPARIVRASFLRFLISRRARVPAAREGGSRQGGLDRGGARSRKPAASSATSGSPTAASKRPRSLRAAIINRLFLDGSRLPGLQAERLEARGGIYLRGAEGRDGDRSRSSASRRQSRMRRRDHQQSWWLCAAGPEPGGSQRAAPRRDTARRRQPVGAVLAADLDATGASIPAFERIALDADELACRGSVALRNARIGGEVRLSRADIGGDLDCSGATVENAGGAAVDVSRGVVAGAFFLWPGRGWTARSR